MISITFSSSQPFVAPTSVKPQPVPFLPVKFPSGDSVDFISKRDLLYRFIFSSELRGNEIIKLVSELVCRQSINKPLTETGTTPLMFAVLSGNVALVEALLTIGNNPALLHPMLKTVKKLFAHPLSALKAASGWDRGPLVEKMLRNDPINVHRQNRNGNTALSIAQERLKDAKTSGNHERIEKYQTIVKLLELGSASQLMPSAVPQAIASPAA